MRRCAAAPKTRKSDRLTVPRERKQKYHPDCSAVVFKLLPGCPLRIGLSIYVRFSQSFTYIGLLATVSGQR